MCGILTKGASILCQKMYPVMNKPYIYKQTPYQMEFDNLRQQRQEPEHKHSKRKKKD